MKSATNPIAKSKSKTSRTTLTIFEAQKSTPSPSLSSHTRFSHLRRYSSLTISQAKADVVFKENDNSNLNLADIQGLF
ncbi:hypothetical protein P8452_00943 [Trifolium repens]|nr:hypothetical protein P8452_00943 [Trifolium repens]